ASELVRPVQAGAGKGPGASAADRDLQPITIILHLVQPAVAAWHGVNERRELDRTEGGEGGSGRRGGAPGGAGHGQDRRSPRSPWPGLLACFALCRRSAASERPTSSDALN